MTSPGQGVVLQLILQTANAQRQLQRDMARAGQQSGQSFRSSFTGSVGNLARELMPVAGATAAVLGFKKIVGSATALNAAVGATRQIFKSSAGSMEEWSKTSSATLGLAQSDALDYAKSLGALFIAQGRTISQAAQMSKALVDAGASLAAFTNTDVAEAQEAVAAGFRGEYDSLQRFLPQVSDAAILQEALRLKLAKTTSAVTAQNKIVALNSLIMNSAQVSAGKVEREQGSLEISLGKAKAGMQDQAATVGRQLVPALTAGLKVTESLGPVFIAASLGAVLLARRMAASAAANGTFSSRMAMARVATAQATVGLQSQQQAYSRLTVTQAIAARGVITANNQMIASNLATAASQTGLGGAVGRLSAQMAVTRAQSGLLASAAVGLRAAGAAASSGMGMLTGALGGPLGIAMLAATVSIGLLVSAHQKAKAAAHAEASATNDLASEIASVNHLFDLSSRQRVAEALEKRGLLAVNERLGFTQDRLTEATIAGGGALRHYVDQAREVTKAQNDQLLADRAAVMGRAKNGEISAREEIKQVDAINKRMKANNQDLKNLEALIPALDKASGAETRVAESTSVLSKEQLGLVDALKGVSDQSKTAEERADSLRDAYDRLYKSSIDSTEAEEARVKSLTELSASIKEGHVNFDLSTAKTNEAKDATLGHRDALEAALQAVRDSSAAAVANGESLATVEARHRANIQAVLDSIPAAQRNTAAVKLLIQQYGSLPTDAKTNLSTTGGDAVKATFRDILKDVEYLLKYGFLPPKSMGDEIQNRPGNRTGGPVARAEGGPIPGKFIGAKADNVTVRATPGEFMEPVHAVNHYGAGLFEALRTESIPREVLPGYAEGGAIGGRPGRQQPGVLPGGRPGSQAPSLMQGDFRYAFNSVQMSVIKKRVEDAARAKFEASKIGKMQSFARAQQGKVYQWATQGPTTYDCSGLVSNLYALATGKALYTRYFSTDNMPLPGWLPGAGAFTMYLGPGHTSANVGGLHAEAYHGNGTPLAIGHIGTPLSYYTSKWHLPGLAEGGEIGRRDRRQIPPSQLKSSPKLRTESFIERGWPEPVVRDTGGWLMPGQTGINMTNMPERVVGPKETVVNGNTPLRLDDYTIAKLAQMISNRPASMAVDGRTIAETAFNHVELR